MDGIVPISQGCRASCTYCISTLARGTLRSYRPEEIISEVGEALAGGRKDIRLTSLDTGQYGRDMGISLAVLLNRVCRIDREFRVRVGMMSPMMLRPIISDLVEAFRGEIRPLTLSTDIIVGFPGEGESEFKDTLDLLR